MVDVVEIQSVLAGRSGIDRQRVNFRGHHAGKRSVNKAVSPQCPQTGKGRRLYVNGVMAAAATGSGVPRMRCAVIAYLKPGRLKGSLQ